jgi:hypothetical protein
MVVPQADEIRVSGPNARSVGGLVTGAFVGAIGTWFIVMAADPANYPPGRWIGGIGGTLFVVEGALLLVLGWRGLRSLSVVRGDALRVVDGLRARTIPFSELSGVGLLFLWVSGRGGFPAGWYLTVWDGAGKSHRVTACWLDAHWTSADYRTVTHPRETAEQLAQSDAGRMARRIYDAAWAVQGSEGPLATKQAQKMRDTTVWTRDYNVYAFWSPDGEMGDFTEASPRPAGDEED